MHQNLGVREFMVSADMINMGMCREKHEGLVQPGRNRCSKRRDGHARVDQKVALAALDEKHVAADKAMAMRLEDPDDTWLDKLRAEPGIRYWQDHTEPSV
jgi:hypothetical protein